MHIPSQPSQIRRMLDSRLKRVAADKPLLAVSLALVYKRCGQPGCACHHGGSAHPAHHLTYKEGARRAPSTSPRISSTRCSHGSPSTNA
jgi:hypothetical protein